MTTNHDNLKDIRELAYVLNGLCQIAEECGRCPLLEDCPNNYPTKGSYASLDEWIAWLNRKHGGNDNDQP